MHLEMTGNASGSRSLALGVGYCEGESGSGAWFGCTWLGRSL